MPLQPFVAVGPLLVAKAVIAKPQWPAKAKPAPAAAHQHAINQRVNALFAGLNAPRGQVHDDNMAVPLVPDDELALPVMPAGARGFPIYKPPPRALLHPPFSERQWDEPPLNAVEGLLDFNVHPQTIALLHASHRQVGRPQVIDDRWLRLPLPFHRYYSRWAVAQGKYPYHFVGLHCTSESGIIGILRDDQVRAGPASKHSGNGWRDVICMMGFLLQGYPANATLLDLQMEYKRLLDKCVPHAGRFTSPFVVEVRAQMDYFKYASVQDWMDDEDSHLKLSRTKCDHNKGYALHESICRPCAIWLDRRWIWD